MKEVISIEKKRIDKVNDWLQDTKRGPDHPNAKVLHRGLSQSELARLLNTNHSIIGKYERDEVKPSVDVVKNLAEVLDTTAAYLLGETQDMSLLKDPDMLKRLNDINNLPIEDKKGILFALDGLLRDAKTRLAYH